MRNSKTKGFTLIELIVVMAIIGVLAAILVPNMISYLKDSKFSKANANAKQAYQSAANWCTKCETNSKPCTSQMQVGLDGSLDLTVTGKTSADIEFDGTKSSDLQTALIVYMGGNKNSGVGGVSCKNSGAEFGRWAGSKTDATASGGEAIFGEYPTEINANKVAKQNASFSKTTPNS